MCDGTRASGKQNPDGLCVQFFRSGKVTAAVCHGPGALVGATDANGEPIFKNRSATSFSDLEEEQVGKVKDIPFLVESRIKELGGRYEKAKEPWQVSSLCSRTSGGHTTQPVCAGACG